MELSFMDRKADLRFFRALHNVKFCRSCHLFFLCADIDSFCEPLYILFCNHSIYFCIIDFIHMLFRCQQTVCQISVIRDQK